MGTLGRCRAAHFWSEIDGFGDDTIRGSMKKNRWKEIAANLTFATRDASSGWDKIKWLDEMLRKKCREACGITQNCTVDESMIKCRSRACPWVQYMPKKPIKWGARITHTLSLTRPPALLTSYSN